MSLPTFGRPPRIGVPAMWSDEIRGLRYSGSVVANAVLEAIVRAGGHPLIIFPGSEFTDWDVIDGIVLPGGSDINPKRYGHQPEEELALTDFDGQDEADAQAISAAESHGIPTLLICRGMQLWNVERGGTMVQHWPREPQEHTGTIHDVSITPESRLAHALQSVDKIDVSSYHHQAVGEVGRGLQVVSRADDGCIEALEDPEYNIVAVQWHPEDRALSNPADQALFDWVVAAAQEHAITHHRAAARTHQEVS